MVHFRLEENKILAISGFHSTKKKLSEWNIVLSNGMPAEQGYFVAVYVTW